LLSAYNVSRSQNSFHWGCDKTVANNGLAGKLVYQSEHREGGRMPVGVEPGCAATEPASIPDTETLALVGVN
jgi:hypothetical protein